MNFTPSEYTYDRIYEAQPLKGVCLFGGNFEPRDYSMVYCGAYFHNLYRLEKKGEGYEGVLQRDYIERLLDNVASSGRTVVFRPVANEGGMKFDENLTALLEADGDVYSNGGIRYPNWDNARLNECFLDFIEKFGKAYDGDPRIACVQLGLYGEFGEWNFCGVKPEHHRLVAMSPERQEAIVAQYCKFFKITKLQARNPDLGNTPNYPVGYHDDNFVFNSAEYHTPGWDAMIDAATVCDGAKEGDWYELHQFEDFIRDHSLYDIWKTQMMGAEISGVMAFKNKDGECFFGNMFEGEALGALLFCISHFHMTFSLGFQRGGGGVPATGTEQYKNFRYAASTLGYDLTLRDARFEDDKLTCDIKNVGIAPMYYDWDVELSLTDKQGRKVYSERKGSRLSALLPMLRQSYTFDLSGVALADGEYTAHLRVINPLECPEDVRYPLILSNKERSGEYATIGKLSV